MLKDKTRGNNNIDKIVIMLQELLRI